jgi:hypothetical protein
MSNDTDAFDQWCIVELLGHRKLAGHVREVQIAGAGFLRLDVPATEGHGAQTQFVSPGSVYALHPTTEEVATAAAANFRPQPVSRWELESKPAADPWGHAAALVDDPDDDDPDDDDPDDDDPDDEGPF